ncbi:MAG: 50S ribosomal protein L18e [Candidatus Bathyarchaeia archaeon]
MRRVKASDPGLTHCISVLKTKSRVEGVGIWGSLAEQLSKPRHHRAAVNVGKINRFSREGDTIVVPGKVLGSGSLTHPVTVAAHGFSRIARLKIDRAGGRHIGIEELVRLNPKGTNVKMIK